ncbi:MAG: helix-turn-helix transcriptional regulator [Prolixibacteraceae bacterium]
MKNKAEKYSSKLLANVLDEISPAEQEKIDKRMLLAAKIDDTRIARGLSRKQLAHALGKQPSEITKWLSGTHNFTSDTLFDLERVLKTTFIRVEKEQPVDRISYRASIQIIVKPDSSGNSKSAVLPFAKYSTSVKTKQVSC